MKLKTIGLSLAAGLALPGWAGYSVFIINTSSRPWYLSGSVGSCPLTALRSGPGVPPRQDYPAGTGKVEIKIPARSTLGLEAEPPQGMSIFMFKFALGDHHGDEPEDDSLVYVVYPATGRGALVSDPVIQYGAAVQQEAGHPASVLQIVAEDWRSVLGDAMEYVDPAPSSSSTDVASRQPSQGPSPDDPPGDLA